MAFSGMINVKTGQLTLGGQFDAYKRGQLERNIQVHIHGVYAHDQLVGNHFIKKINGYQFYNLQFTGSNKTKWSFDRKANDSFIFT